MFLSCVCRKKHSREFCSCSESPLKAIQPHGILLMPENLPMEVVIIMLLILLEDMKNVIFVFSPMAPFAMVLNISPHIELSHLSF